jgi:HPt (histidine-containing phosphotransfer) domain-containing protein
MLNFIAKSKHELMKIDLSYLREMSGGNKELILDMISIFNSQVVEIADEMDQLLKNKEYVALGKLAHKAKSSVAIMGLNDLAAELKNLENSAVNEKNINTYPVIVSKFRAETAGAIDELNLVINNLELYF